METHGGSSWRGRARVVVRGRQRLRSGVLRLRGGWVQIFQTGVAACVSWFLAVWLLGLEEPTFAPIAAVISLGLAVGERSRRVVELTLGVAFGVLIADRLVSVIGVGLWQGGVLVVLAMVVTVFLGRRDLGVNEAAITAMILMITFGPVGTGFPPDRFLEALIGGATALLVNVLLPVDAERMVREAAHPIFAQSVVVLEEVAKALDDGDLPRVQNAYVKAREIDARVSGFKEVLAAGRETARLAPARRRSLPHLEVYAAAADQIDLTVRQVRALARAALGLVEHGAAASEPLSGAVRDDARATQAIGVYLELPGGPEDARRFALDAARKATALLGEREDLARNLPANAFVERIHSSAFDILVGTGMDREEARRAMEEDARRASNPNAGTPNDNPPDTA